MSPHSLLLGAVALAYAIAPAQGISTPGSYRLVDSYQGTDFLTGFDFFSEEDPTNGFVNYLDQSAAQAAGLAHVMPSGAFYMGVDSTSMLTPDPNATGRNSVRVESKKAYDTGLFIADVKHMPASVCGTWPAFWTVGPDWPTDGEIDIIEAVNAGTNSQLVLHTGSDCLMSSNAMSGTLMTTQCDAGDGHFGCAVQAAVDNVGTPFNNIGGGVYAMELTSSHIAIWFFPRTAVPASITSGHPDVSTFGMPTAFFQGTCNLAQRFNKQRIVFDTTFCGDWAGAVFTESGCPARGASDPAQSCVNYVAQNPGAFQNSYWEVNYVNVYQSNAASSSMSSMSTPAPSSSMGGLSLGRATPVSGVKAARTSGMDYPSSVAAAFSSAPDVPTPVETGADNIAAHLSGVASALSAGDGPVPTAGLHGAGPQVVTLTTTVAPTGLSSAAPAAKTATEMDMHMGALGGPSPIAPANPPNKGPGDGSSSGAHSSSHSPSSSAMPSSMSSGMAGMSSMSRPMSRSMPSGPLGGPVNASVPMSSSSSTPRSSSSSHAPSSSHTPAPQSSSSMHAPTASAKPVPPPVPVPLGSSTGTPSPPATPTHPPVSSPRPAPHMTMTPAPSNASATPSATEVPLFPGAANREPISISAVMLGVAVVAAVILA